MLKPRKIVTFKCSGKLKDKVPEKLESHKIEQAYPMTSRIIPARCLAQCEYATGPG